MISFSISDEMVLLGNQKLYYKNGVKMVSEQNEKAENVELSRLIKFLGVLITYIRIHLMSGIRLVISYRMIFNGLIWNCRRYCDSSFLYRMRGR